MFNVQIFRKSVKQLGHGGYGDVFLMDHPQNGQMAVKFFRNAQTQSDPGIKLATKREIENIVQHTRHMNIKQFFGYVTELIGEKRAITGYAMEYMPDGCLSKVIHSSPKIHYEPHDVASWGRQAALALSWLHFNTYIHRDVKPLNMLLSHGRSILKLCDFGTTRTHGGSMSACSGTTVYMAPEVLTFDNTGQYSYKCDVYSMGVTLWETLTREYPFESMRSILELHSCVSQGGRPPIELIQVDAFKAIIEKCFEADPNSRPTMKQIEDNMKVMEVGLKATQELVQNMSLNNARNAILRMTRRLREVSNILLLKKKQIKDNMNEVKEFASTGKDLRGKLTVDQLRNFHDRRPCAHQRRVWNSYCCPNPQLQSCSALRQNIDKCRMCGCGWQTHMYRRFKLVQKMIKVVDPTVEASLANKANIPEMVNLWMATEQRKVDELTKETAKITEYCAEFDDFLVKHSIIPYNDTYGSYIDHLISGEKHKVSLGASNSLLNELMTYKAEYTEQVRLLNHPTESNPKSPEDIDRMIKELINMKIW